MDKHLKLLSPKQKKAMRKAVEGKFEKYRMFKYLGFEEREVNITSAAEIRYHGATNVTSDQTGSIAINNVDQIRMRKAYCEHLERLVGKLPEKEKELIQKRYMSTEADYITDYHVYCFELDPPISAATYAKVRDKAMYKIALNLKIEIEQG